MLPEMNLYLPLPPKGRLSSLRVAVDASTEGVGGEDSPSRGGTVGGRAEVKWGEAECPVQRTALAGAESGLAVTRA